MYAALLKTKAAKPMDGINKAGQIVYRIKYYPEYKSTWKELFEVLEMTGNNPHLVSFGKIFIGKGNCLQSDQNGPQFRALTENQTHLLREIQNAS